MATLRAWILWLIPFSPSSSEVPDAYGSAGCICPSQPRASDEFPVGKGSGSSSAAAGFVFLRVGKAADVRCDVDFPEAAAAGIVIGDSAADCLRADPDPAV